MRNIVITCLVALGFLPAVAAAQSIKIGYVNVPYLIENSPQARAASAALKAQFGPKQEKLRQKKKEFQELKNKLRKKSLVMSDKKRSKLKEKLRTMKRKIRRMQAAFRQDLNIERNKAFKKVRRAVLKAVRDVAKSQGYDLIVGQGALYVSETVNVTKQVLQHMKEEYTASSGG